MITVVTHFIKHTLCFSDWKCF